MQNLQNAIQQSLQQNTFKMDFSVAANVDLGSIEASLNRVETDVLTLPSIDLEEKSFLAAAGLVTAAVAGLVSNVPAVAQSEEAQGVGETEGGDAIEADVVPIVKPTLADFFNLKEKFGLGESAGDDAGDHAAAADSEGAEQSEAEEGEENLLAAELKAQIQSKLEEQMSGLPSAFFGAAVTGVVEKMNEALEQISVGRDILGIVWTNAKEIIDYRDRAIQTPNLMLVIPLTDHEVAISQTSTIEPQFKEQPLGTFEFPVNFSIRLSKAMIEMQDGRIKRIHVKASLGAGSLGLGDNTLLKIPEVQFNLGTIDLGAGIKIG